jgi:RNA polymerase sigma-B factor
VPLSASSVLDRDVTTPGRPGPAEIILRVAVPENDRRRRTEEALVEAATASPDRRRALLDEVVEINMGVARSVASRYFRRGIDQDDILQVAYVALTRAARDFDAGRHRDFLAYAVPTMRGEIKKHFRDHGWTVRPPRRIQEMQQRISACESELVHALGRSPRPSEIADHLGADVDDVVEALGSDGCFTPSSLDRPVAGQDGSTAVSLADLLGDLDPDQPAAEARATLAPVVRRLKERDRRILFLRFFEDRTQQEIADELGVTQMQVSRLITRIMRDLRRDLGAEPIAS